jgi:hypothetical protein
VVTHWWNVSTGEEWALKEVKDPRNIERRRWELEVQIMGEISHVSHLNIQYRDGDVSSFECVQQPP